MSQVTNDAPPGPTSQKPAPAFPSEKAAPPTGDDVAPTAPGANAAPSTARAHVAPTAPGADAAPSTARAHVAPTAPGADAALASACENAAPTSAREASAPGTARESTVPAPAATFAAFHAGPLADWRRHEFTHPFLGNVRGKLFLKEPLGLTGLEMSLSAIAPGRGIPFLHRHRRNEEVYLFLSGRGEFQVDGQVFDVTEGSAVRVSPSGARAYRNTGEGALVFLVVQAPADAGVAADITDGRALPDPVVWP